MLERLNGTLESVRPEGIHLRLGGVTLRLIVSRTTAQALGPEDRDVALYTHLAMREDTIILYGFATLEERELFLRLIGVNGVGPRSALALCSLLAPPALIHAIEEGDTVTLSLAPGVGRRLAARIVLELRGKLVEPETPRDVELLGALLALGYSRSEGSAALAALPVGTAALPLDERLRTALRYFAG